MRHRSCNIYGFVHGYLLILATSLETVQELYAHTGRCLFHSVSSADCFEDSRLEMSHFNGSHTSAHRSDYVWQYEYYDEEEPVSFEGLKAHKYSIVIGFWVGLAVFVIFMFFVLTLLTKTGAPHQDNLDSENCPRPENGLDGLTTDDDTEKAFSRPLLTESRSYFHFYITQDQTLDKPSPEELSHSQTFPKLKDCTVNGIQDILQDPEDYRENHNLNLVLEDTTKTDHKDSFTPHFTIPNFVNLEHP